MVLLDQHGNVHDRTGRFAEQQRPEAAVALAPRADLVAKSKRMMAGRSTEQLIFDLRTAERQREENNTEQVRMVSAWLTDEVLSRLPEVRERVHAFLDDDTNLDDDRSTGQVIEDTIRGLASEGK